MTQYAWQVSEPTPAIRVAMAAVWAYFLTTLAVAAGFTATILLTDWPFANKYGSSVMFFAVFGCMIWYPMAQLMAFRAPARSWNSIGFLMLINILLLSGFHIAAAGELYQSAFMFLAVGIFVIGRWRQSRREPALRGGPMCPP